MSYRDMILEYLSDGEWHTTTDVSDAIGLPRERRSTAHFLLKIESKYGTVESKLEKTPHAMGGGVNRLWRLVA